MQTYDPKVINLLIYGPLLFLSDLHSIQSSISSHVQIVIDDPFINSCTPFTSATIAIVRDLVVLILCYYLLRCTGQQVSAPTAAAAAIHSALEQISRWSCCCWRWRRFNGHLSPIPTMIVRRPPTKADDDDVRTIPSCSLILRRSPQAEGETFAVVGNGARQAAYLRHTATTTTRHWSLKEEQPGRKTIHYSSLWQVYYT